MKNKLTEKNTVQKLKEKITELEKSLVHSKQSEEQLKLITENTTDNIAIVSFDLKAVYEYVNPSVKTVVGWEPKDLVGKSFFHFIHPGDKKVIFQLLRNYVNKKIKKLLIGKEESLSESIEYRFKHKNGDWRYLQSTINIADKKLLSVSRDITDRLEIEHNLQESEKKYRALYNNAPLAFHSLNIDGYLIDVNPEWINILGYDYNDVVGKYYGDFLHPDWIPKFKKNFAIFKKQGFVHNVHFKIQHKNGKYFDILLEGNIGNNPDGSFKQSYCVFKDITESVRADELLKNQEKRIQSIYRSAPIGIGLVSNRILLDVNDKLCKMVGYSRDELIDQDSLILYPTKTDYETVGKEKYDQIKKYGTGTVETRFKRKNGKIIDVIMSSTPIDVNDLSKGVTFTALNITHRKEMEIGLIESEKKFRDMTNLIPQTIYEHDINGKITFANKHGLELFGYSHKEYKNGINIQKLLIPEDRNRAKKNNEILFSGKQPADHEFTALRKDGTAFPVLIYSNLILKKKLPIGARGIVVDISQRKQYEEELFNSEERLALAVEGAGLGLWDQDFVSDKIVRNERWSQMLGYDIGEIEQNRSAWRELIHPDDLDFLEKSIQEHEKGKTSTFDIEHRMRTKNNEWKWIHNWGRVVERDSKGLPIRALGVHLDITERKRAEKEIDNKSQELGKQIKISEGQRIATLSVMSDLNQTTKELKIYQNQLEDLVKERTGRLEEANKELEAFSYSVSHDLRAPLRAINGFTKILVEDHASKLDKEGIRIGSVIQQNANKMGKLIDDLLAFSRMGRSSLNPSKIDMKNMVKSMFYEVTNEEQRKRIKLNIADLPKIDGDTIMMRQVWINLISNAVKFSSHKKQTVISVTSSKENNKITYCIKDNGAGFNMKYVDKVFGVFQRLHDEKEFEGTGVGMALTKRIISRHNGNIWAKGIVDKGAEFYFSLPEKG